MDRLTRERDLKASWRALEGSAEDEGWKTISVANEGICRAGRHFPGDEEALLVCFPADSIFPHGQLPEGRGFIVVPVDPGAVSENTIWFAILRKMTGNLEMFTVMATDIVCTVESANSPGNKRLFGIFLERIRAWQSFMESTSEGVLSREKEVGLHGELLMLASLLESRVPACTALESWKGPVGGVHDFRLGFGAIEVKTAVSLGSFTAKISSLEQLDDSTTKPLFIAAVRLQLDDSGLDLCGRVSVLRNSLLPYPEALEALEIRLLQAGFFPAFSERYFRCFTHVNTVFFTVERDFPRLTRCTVPTAIRSAHYEIDLELVDVGRTDLVFILESLGVP